MNITFLVDGDSQQEYSIKDRIYQKIVEYLADQISDKTLIECDSSKKWIEEFNCCQEQTVDAVVATPTAISMCFDDLACLSAVIILIGECPQKVRDVADLVIDPLGRNQREYFSGPEYLPREVLKQCPIDQVASYLDISTETLEDVVRTSVAGYALKEAILLCRPLEWDSQFFGFPVAFVTTRRLTPTIEKYIRKYVSEKSIKFLEYCCNCHDPISVMTAEDNDYRFVDIRVTLEKDLTKQIAPTSELAAVSENSPIIRRATESDIDGLAQLTNELYLDSRYFFDGNFSKDELNKFYSDWLTKSVRGEFDDCALMILNTADGETPAGFCTFRKKIVSESVAVIGLFGIAPGFHRQGYASNLLRGVFRELQSLGLGKVEVVTQGRNYEAQRVYQREGFVTKTMELWYHKWFD